MYFVCGAGSVREKIFKGDIWSVYGDSFVFSVCAGIGFWSFDL